MSSENFDTLRLTLELLRRIPRTRKVTASQLREQLADIGMVRDVRTIQRQLAALSEPFGIERDGGRPIGYRWKKRAAGMSVIAMSEHEALLLMLAQQHLRAMLPPSLMKGLDGFFAEARRSLDAFGDKRHAKEWLAKVRVIGESVKMIAPTVRAGVFETVSQALYANRWLHVRYRAADEKISAKQVMPLGLAQQGPRLYLVCRYEADGEERSLALHRILSAHATTLDFVRPADFDFERFDDEGRLAFGDGSRVQLSFRIDAKTGAHLRETPLSKEQTVEPDGDWLKITATVTDSLLLKRWLQSFGSEVTDVRRKPVRARSK